MAGPGDCGSADLHAFARRFLPKLRAVPPCVMAEATGLSEGYCSCVRRGRKVPHARHWATLAGLGEERDPLGMPGPKESRRPSSPPSGRA